jgi:hypothetical protein
MDAKVWLALSADGTGPSGRIDDAARRGYFPSPARMPAKARLRHWFFVQDTAPGVSGMFRYRPSGSSVTATLIVEQRAQRTRTFFVICMACIDSARTFPHRTQT